MSQPLDLEAIKARAEAATPGPWEVGKPADTEEHWVVAFDDDTVLLPPVHWCEGPGSEFSADISFIAHARTDVPALVAEVERLKKIINR